MICEYFSSRDGEAFCKAYGRLDKVSQEKIRECQSSYEDCFQRAEQFLREERRKGIINIFIGED